MCVVSLGELSGMEQAKSSVCLTFKREGPVEEAGVQMEGVALLSSRAAR